MKNEKIYLKGIISFTFIAVAIIFSSTSARAAVNLPNLVIPDSPNFISTQNFAVVGMGELKVVVKIKLNTPRPPTSYKIQLVKGSRDIVVTKNVQANHMNYKTVELKYNLTSCARTGLYKIRIKVNNPGSPGWKATAVFPAFKPPNPPGNRCTKSPKGNGQKVTALRSRQILVLPRQKFFSGV